MRQTIQVIKRILETVMGQLEEVTYKTTDSNLLKAVSSIRECRKALVEYLISTE